MRAWPLVLLLLPLAGCSGAGDGGDAGADAAPTDADLVVEGFINGTTTPLPRFAVAGKPALDLDWSGPGVGRLRLSASSNFSVGAVAWRGEGEAQRHGLLLLPAGTDPAALAANLTCGPADARLWDSVVDAAAGAPAWDDLPPGEHDLWLWNLGGAGLTVGFNGAAAADAGTNATPAATGWEAVALPAQRGPVGPRAPVDWSFRHDAAGPGFLVARLVHGLDAGPRQASLQASQGGLCAEWSAASGPEPAAVGGRVVAAVGVGPLVWAGDYHAAGLVQGGVEAHGVLLRAPAR